MKNLNVLGLYFLLAIIVSWPLILHLNTLIIDRYDGLLITWILNWDIHSLTSGLSGILNFYNANIFFPYKNTLAFSDLQLPLAIIGLPFVIIFNEPLLAYNINILLGFTLTAFSVYFLIKQITKDQGIAIFAGILFSFSTIHLNYIAHLQLFNFWPVVLAIYFLLRKKYVRYGIFFVISGLTTALFIYFLLAIFVVWGLGRIRVVGGVREIREGTIVLIASGLVLGLMMLPFFFVSREFHYVRPINDAIHFSLSFQDLANVSSFSRLSGLVKPVTKGTPGYLGGVMVILVISLVGLIGQIRRERKTKIWLIVVLAAFILALGPALHLVPETVHVGPLRAIPLPYAVLYYLVPGFSGLRTPSRWIILTVLALVVLISMFLQGRLKRLGRLGKLGVLGGLTFFVLAEISFPFKYQKVPGVSEFPPEQKWLVGHYLGEPIVQFPIYGWWSNPGLEQETLREYFATIHWHPMYNGYSGFSPKEWEESVKWLQRSCPSEECLQFLKGKGIKLIVQDDKGDKGDPTSPFGLRGVNWGDQGVRLVEKFPEASIYEIL